MGWAHISVLHRLRKKEIEQSDIFEFAKGHSQSSFCYIASDPKWPRSEHNDQVSKSEVSSNPNDSSRLVSDTVDFWDSIAWSPQDFPPILLAWLLLEQTWMSMKQTCMKESHTQLSLYFKNFCRTFCLKVTTKCTLWIKNMFNISNRRSRTSITEYFFSFFLFIRCYREMPDSD